MAIHLPHNLLQRLPAGKREGIVATMAIHDPVTGALKRHIIRKVTLLHKQFVNVYLHSTIQVWHKYAMTKENYVNVAIVVYFVIALFVSVLCVFSCCFWRGKFA